MASQVLSDIKIYGNGSKRLFDKLGEAIGSNKEYQIPTLHEPTEEESEILGGSFLEKNHNEEDMDDFLESHHDLYNEEDEENDDEEEEEEEDDDEEDYHTVDPYVSLLELNATKHTHVTGIHRHILDQSDAENELLDQAGQERIEMAKRHSPVVSPRLQSHIQLSNEDVDDDKMMPPTDTDDSSLENMDSNGESNAELTPESNAETTPDSIVEPNDTTADATMNNTTDDNAPTDANTDDIVAPPNGVSDLDPSKYPADLDADDLIPKNAEDMLSVDLQGSQPDLRETEPHSIEGRHSWNDIKMTESLRTGELGTKAASGTHSISLGLSSIVILFASIYHYYI